MLDLGFIHALKRIVRLIPEKRQTLFFSATMPKTIRQLADSYLRNPAEVKVTPVATTAERVEQSVTFVNQAEKQALLTHFFRSTKIDRSLVFSRTKHGADKIVRFLAAAGIDANAIHGNKSQAQRERALDLFRTGDVPILVATDIAARGIDIPGVSHVLNFDLPNVPEQYVHRIGRTARAGAAGQAIAFCAEDERPYLRDIERLTRQKIDAVALPGDFREIVAAVGRLKAPPRRTDTRPGTPRFKRDAPSAEIKADRRAENRGRQNRNERQPGQSRHPQRAEGHPGHRPEGGRPNRPFRGRRRPSSRGQAQA
jgi:ATP-dependent RNA helicase RhlE